MLKLRFILLLMITSNAAAESAHWSAFGTLGLTLSDSNLYGYRSDISRDDGVFSGDIDFNALSLLGGQVEKSFSPSFDFVGQAVLRDIGNAGNDQYITMAFLRYSPSTNWTFRAGRLSPDLFMITEYRNVNIAYTWANIPNEMYGMLPFKYIDGADITYSQRFNNGTLNFKLFTGQTESLFFAFGQDELIELDHMYGGSFIYDQNTWNLQARYTHAEIGNEAITTMLLAEQISLIPDALWPNKENIYDQLSIEGESAEYYSFSGQKYWDNWLFTFELAQIDSDSEMLEKVSSGYISAAYQRGAHTYYSVYAKTRADTYIFNEDIQAEYIPGIEELIGGIESVMNFYSSNQNTVSVGWRWDITPSITSKFQLNTSKIDENGATLWLNPKNSKSKETVSGLMYTLSFAL